MSILFKSFFFLSFIIVCTSCNATKTSNSSTEDNDLTNSEYSEMKSQGFSLGTLSTNKSSGCSIVLTIEKMEDKLDPVNIEEFVKGGMPQKVWVKYASMRMANRCENARPVTIQEMQIIVQ
ncbi:hypothetical protein [Aquimarina brevivitae]|uniref:Lipoprotein n=1 Tax=Aquimarina brevivitae TaxID=323412 RepID=A0A4Q7PGA7_9FLAO|nr:hypothetical protein [Aquimarina brevivitae]RZS99395.1 hypothetical protein EV197_0605 [Aquimarina brevivitae]